MLYARTLLVLLSPVGLAACAVADTAPPPVAAAPVAQEAPVDTPPPPPPAPLVQQPSLQERWRAPFAVRSSGRTAEREPRRVVVLAAEPAPSAAPRDSVRVPAAAPAPPARSSAPATAAGTRTHKVEWGETWLGIARRYEIPPAALAAANPQIDPERLRSGQVLRIPGGGAVRPGQRTHTVAAGETLWSIARRYGVTVDQLRQVNRLRDDLVRSGQTLIVP